ncbi:MAG TPA: hypothetical protein VIA06_15320 [Candidatus Dormibacteraeota bacterium]|jgi:hypothetical protein|nr:hypothetical protein [Candidatus Dormibacteraeota bacterium]
MDYLGGDAESGKEPWRPGGRGQRPARRGIACCGVSYCGRHCANLVPGLYLG